MVTSPENSKINGLTFKELIKRGYSLEGNTRIWNIADSKLWYLEPAQAQGYLDLENSTNYKDATGQVQSKSLITENIDNIINQIHDDHINIIDLGCGDGTKAANIVRELKKKKPSLKIRYCPIDISSYMVEKAILTFHSMEIDEVIDFQYNISDFENLPNVIPFLRRGEYKKNLILLLGNTLGNFEIHELLYKIRSSMKGDDLFILDTAIDDKQQEKRVQSYNNSEVLNKWLIHIPLQLGLEEDEVKIGFRWKNHRIEGYYTLLVNKEISFHGKEVKFQKGDQIIIIVAYKYDIEDLGVFLNIHFGTVGVYPSKDNSKVLAICKK